MGKGGEGQGGRGRGEKGRPGRLILMRSWNRAADWLRPALLVSPETGRAIYVSGINNRSDSNDLNNNATSRSEPAYITGG